MGIKTCEDRTYEVNKSETKEHTLLILNKDVGQPFSIKDCKYKAIILYSYKERSIGPIIFEGESYTVPAVLSKENKQHIFIDDAFINMFLLHIAYITSFGLHKIMYENLALPINSVFYLEYPSLNFRIDPILHIFE
jgi:hypothetical protein